MVYTFHEDEHGKAVSEVNRPNLELYSGLHYPETDISQAARFLFLQNRGTMICDARADPVPIVRNQIMEKPLLLGKSTLRVHNGSHTQYMINMNSITSLVLEIVVNENNRMKLWGLVSCHHIGPNISVEMENLRRVLQVGQGLVGRAVQENNPLFSSDIKGYGIQEYPQVHHARKFNLGAALAIRVRSTGTGTNDYVLELFLPTDCRESSDQQRLVTSIYDTMQNVCGSLRIVTEAEVVDNVSGCLLSTLMDGQTSQPVSHVNLLTVDNNLAMQNLEPLTETREHDVHRKQKNHLLKRDISRGTLSKYFSATQKEAAARLGVGISITTLKKVCRQHGIEKWPGKSVKKVYRERLFRYLQLMWLEIL